MEEVLDHINKSETKEEIEVFLKGLSKLAGHPLSVECKHNPLATFPWCPNCDSKLIPEHAHYRCAICGWRDSCCD